jgi:SEC-C motif
MARSVPPFGFAELDEHLLGGGLRLDHLHEIVEGGAAATYAGLATLFTAGIAARKGPCRVEATMPTIKTEIFAKTFTTNPSEISASILSLCTEINQDHKPTWVQVVPEHNAVVRECFTNVSNKVARDGGSLVHGWAIWEWKRVFVEAEHHAVWEKRGELTDVTPHPNGEKTILFLPDPTRVYDFEAEKRLVNFKRSLNECASADYWIAATDDFHNATEAHSVGREIRMPRNRLAALQLGVRNAMAAILVELASKIGPNSSCICASGRKFKKCCGPLTDLSK